MPRKKIDYNLIETIDSSKVPGMYETGELMGSVEDIQFTQQLLAKLKTPVFGVTANELMGDGAGKLSLPHLVVYK